MRAFKSQPKQICSRFFRFCSRLELFHSCNLLEPEVHLSSFKVPAARPKLARKRFSLYRKAILKAISVITQYMIYLSAECHLWRTTRLPFAGPKYHRIQTSTNGYELGIENGKIIALSLSLRFLLDPTNELCALRKRFECRSLRVSCMSFCFVSKYAYICRATEFLFPVWLEVCN